MRGSRAGAPPFIEGARACSEFCIEGPGSNPPRTPRDDCSARCKEIRPGTDFRSQGRCCSQGKFRPAHPCTRSSRPVPKNKSHTVNTGVGGSRGTWGERLSSSAGSWLKWEGPRGPLPPSGPCRDLCSLGLGFRSQAEVHRQPGVRDAHPQAHDAALHQPPAQAPASRALGPQWHGQDLPDQPAG